MSKSHIEAFARGQFKAIVAKDNKERLKFTVAGCKDGCLYDHSGTNYGLFNNDAPDTEWITPKDLELKRITGVKLESINKKATAFFAEYGDGLANAEAVANGDEDEAEDEAPVEETETVDAPAETESEIDYEAVAKACKKAIKKEDIKKATKLLAKLEGHESHKKLAKKLGKLA